MRRFEPEQRFLIDGFQFRVVQGRKLRRTDQSPGHDLRLDYWNPQKGWLPVSMELGAFLADFFYENENALSPEPFMGGRYYIEYLRASTQIGWRKATEILRRERGASKQQKGAAA